jgi:hypothetical protein
MARLGPLVLVLALVAATPAPRAEAAAHRRPDVVLMTVDELALDALRARDGGIDGVRFPNFAALARRSTWFRNTVAVAPWTYQSMPAILDGRIPPPGAPAPGTAPGVPRPATSLFTMLSRHGYGIVDAETVTRICPLRLCPHNTGTIHGYLRSPHRVRIFHGWLRRVRPRRHPTFWMTQLSLPHWPYVYLPSGRIAKPPLEAEQLGAGFANRYLTEHGEQRFLLQLEFTDHLLGQLLARLRRYKMLDETLLVVAGDHGLAFASGTPSRRVPRPGNLGEIGPVAFFVKAPHQRHARIDDSFHRNVDVTPTIADVLGVPLGFPSDGQTAFRPGATPSAITIPPADFPDFVRIPLWQYVQERMAAAQRRLSLFGTGHHSLFAFWSHRSLLGRRLRRRLLRTADHVRARIIGAAAFRHVRRSRGTVPTAIGARVVGGLPGAERDVAVAVNGRIRATGKTFHLTGDPREWASLMVPERSLREGANDIRLLEVLPGGRLRTLAHQPR